MGDHELATGYTFSLGRAVYGALAVGWMEGIVNVFLKSRVTIALLVPALMVILTACQLIQPIPNPDDPGVAATWSAQIATRTHADYAKCPLPDVVRTRDRRFGGWEIYVQFGTSSTQAIQIVVNDCLRETNKFTQAKWAYDFQNAPHSWGPLIEFATFAQNLKGSQYEQIEISDEIDPARSVARYIEVTRRAATKEPVRVDVLMRG